MEVVGESVGLDKDGEDKKKKSYAGIPEAAFVVSKYILLLWNIMYAIWALAIIKMRARFGVLNVVLNFSVIECCVGWERVTDVSEERIREANEVELYRNMNMPEDCVGGKS